MRELVSDRVKKFVRWIELSFFFLFANARVGLFCYLSACDFCCMLRRILLDTCVLYTFLNSTYLFISLLNLYPDSELIISDIIKKNLHSVYRSLDPQLRTDFVPPPSRPPSPFPSPLRHTHTDRWSFWVYARLNLAESATFNNSSSFFFF